MTTATPTETTQRCDFRKVKVGNVFSRHSFGTVIAIRGDMLQLRNSEGYEWTIDANILIQEFSFAEQYDEEEKVSRTRIIEVLTENPGTAMTVCFMKKAKPGDVAKELAAGQGSLTQRAWNTKVKDLMEGEERVMVGQHHGTWDEHRRLHFNEATKGNRLVDPRTIRWLICRRTKYTVK
jgi:hypothetical protein